VAENTYTSRPNLDSAQRKLGLISIEEIDRRAINQIYNQIENKLEIPILGTQLVSLAQYLPYPKIKFFALSGLSNESNLRDGNQRSNSLFANRAIFQRSL